MSQPDSVSVGRRRLDGYESMQDFPHPLPYVPIAGEGRRRSTRPIRILRLSSCSAFADRQLQQPLNAKSPTKVAAKFRDTESKRSNGTVQLAVINDNKINTAE